jgi:hypothetical protein
VSGEIISAGLSLVHDTYLRQNTKIAHLLFFHVVDVRPAISIAKKKQKTVPCLTQLFSRKSLIIVELSASCRA